MDKNWFEQHKRREVRAALWLFVVAILSCAAYSLVLAVVFGGGE